MEGAIIYLFIIGMIVFFIILKHFSVKSKILRNLKKSPVKTVSSIQPGNYEKLVGRALHVNELIKAPISGRDCIFYQTEVFQKRKDSWSTLIKETSLADFFLDCNGELVIIKMDQPNNFREILLEKDHSQLSGFLKDAPENLKEYLKRFGKESTNFFGNNKTIRYKEGILELQEQIVVKGIAQWKELKKPIKGYNYSKILTLQGSEKQKLIITDIKEALKT